MSETVLITGATGLVGAPTVARFAADGWQVATAHRRTPKDVATGVRIRPTDLSDQTDIERLVSEVAPAVIVHLAAVIPPQIHRSNLAWVVLRLGSVDPAAMPFSASETDEIQRHLG